MWVEFKIRFYNYKFPVNGSVSSCFYLPIIFLFRNANPSKYPVNNDNNGTLLSDSLIMGADQDPNNLQGMVNQPLPDPLMTQQNDTFPIPSRSPNESVQDYELPVSQTTPSSGDKQSKLHVYSTLDDAASEKHHYEENVDFGDTGSKNYASLYPPNMADAQPYMSCTPSPKRVPPQQINEPSTPVAKSADKASDAQQTDKTQQSIDLEAFGNPMYIESSGVGNDEKLYFVLEKGSSLSSQ